jgi:hypothetical protein
MYHDISDFDAAAIAASWHSVITWSDPGVAMYSVTSTGMVHSEEHRENLLAYIDTCVAQATDLDARDKPPTLPEMFESNVEELEALREWATEFKIGGSL